MRLFQVSRGGLRNDHSRWAWCGSILTRKKTEKFYVRCVTEAVHNRIQHRYVGGIIGETSRSKRMPITSTRCCCDPVHSWGGGLPRLSLSERHAITQLLKIDWLRRAWIHTQVKVRAEHQDMLAYMKETMEKTEYVAITSDCWTLMFTYYRFQILPFI